MFLFGGSKKGKESKPLTDSEKLLIKYIELKEAMRMDDSFAWDGIEQDLCGRTINVNNLMPSYRLLVAIASYGRPTLLMARYKGKAVVEHLDDKMKSLQTENVKQRFSSLHEDSPSQQFVSRLTEELRADLSCYLTEEGHKTLLAKLTENGDYLEFNEAQIISDLIEEVYGNMPSPSSVECLA